MEPTDEDIAEALRLVGFDGIEAQVHIVRTRQYSMSFDSDDIRAHARTIAKLRMAVEHIETLADDLEDELDAKYPAEATSLYPDIKRRFDRDMSPIINARAFIAHLKDTDHDDG